MQKSTTIIGVLEMLGDGFSYNDIRTRYAIGNSTITDINKKFKTMDVTLKQLHSMTPKLIEQMFYPNAHPRKEARILRKSIKSLQIKIPERISILFGLIIRSYIQMATSTRSLNITLNYGLMKIIWEAILEWQSIESLVKSCI